ncbi:MAG: DUF2752 domain-containing protein [Vicinamibacteria bacterium]|nr:DUF2752 domain-containing protein [Vicinamibacteria bacterium]
MTVKRNAFPTGMVLGAVGLLAGLAVRLLHLDHLPFAICTFRLTTGLPCMTCGSTRALGRLMALDFMGAFEQQPLVTILMLALLLWCVTETLLYLTMRRAFTFEASPRAWVRIGLAAMILLLSNWAYVIWQALSASN